MSWVWDRSHFPTRVTAALADIYCDAAEQGLAGGFARYGINLGGWDVRPFEGLVHVRMRDDIPDSDDRDSAAAAALRTRRWLADVQAWSRERVGLVHAVQELCAVDLPALSDRALADHLTGVAAMARGGTARHFELHLADMVPLGRLLVAAQLRGIATADVLATTGGLSPYSRRPGVAAMVIGRLDVDAPARLDVVADDLLEVPESHAPFGDRLLDALHADVAATFWVRDDNATILLSAPVALLGRALREVEARTGAAAIEATAGEAVALLADDNRGPDNAVLRQRAERRQRPPGPLVDDLPVSPAPTRSEAGPHSHELTEAFLAYDRLYEATDAVCSIGTSVVRGRAIVGETPDEIIGRMTPGAILVVRTTSPAFDAVLANAAAVVCEEGGALSHAAISARELGIPALIGLAGATAIRDGALIEVDPSTGRATILHETGPTDRGGGVVS